MLGNALFFHWSTVNNVVYQEYKYTALQKHIKCITYKTRVIHDFPNSGSTVMANTLFEETITTVIEHWPEALKQFEVDNAKILFSALPFQMLEPVYTSSACCDASYYKGTVCNFCVSYSLHKTEHQYPER